MKVNFYPSLSEKFKSINYTYRLNMVSVGLGNSVEQNHNMERWAWAAVGSSGCLWWAARSSVERWWEFPC